MKQIITLFFLFCIIFSPSAQTYNEWIDKSFDALEKDDLIGAEAGLRAAMKIEPANPQNFLLLTNLGTIQRRLGRKEDALMSYSAGLGIHPKSITLLENRASLYTEMNQPEKAISDYDFLIIQEPEHQEALYCRGLLYVQIKSYTAAQMDFERIMEINEKSVRARLGHAILARMRGDYVESEKIYNYLITQMPKDMILYQGRAELFFLMGKNARAMGDINKVFSLGTPEVQAYVLRGKIKLGQYEKESAMKDFLKAKELGYDPLILDELMQMAE